MKKFRDYSLGVKLRIMVVLALVPLLAIFWFKVLPDTEEQFMQNKKRELKSVVELAVSVLDFYSQKVRSGQMTLSEAQEKAGLEITSLRYAGKEYFFAYDLDGYTKALGSDASKIGSNRKDLIDKKGNRFVEAMIDIARKSGSGYVTYYYPKAGETNALPKLSFIKLFPEWNWFVGSGLYLDDVNESISAFNNALLISILIGLIVAIIIGTSLARVIKTPITKLGIAAQDVARGNYNINLQYDSKDEIGKLTTNFTGMAGKIQNAMQEIQREQAEVQVAYQQAKTAQEKAEQQERYLKEAVEAMLREMQKFAKGNLLVYLPETDSGLIGKLFAGFNAAVHNVRSMMLRIQELSESVASAGIEISANTDELAAGMQQQSHQVTEVTTAVAEMTNTISENSKSVTGAAEASKNAGDTASSGGKEIEKTIDGMNRIAEVVKRSSDTVKALGDNSQQIGAIIQVIDEIADQTNLLALNAAIEAARAGEQGRGFAVVADEVRKLAERTTKATKEIAEMIKKIQHDTVDAVESMKLGQQEVEIGRGQAAKAGSALHEIITSTQKVADLINQVASASEEQSSTAALIQQSISGMSQVTHDSASGITQIAHASDDMSRLTSQLNDLMKEFIVQEEHNVLLSRR